MAQEINVVSKTQIISVDRPSGAVAINNAGPPGPAGPAGPEGDPGPEGPPGSVDDSAWLYLVSYPGEIVVDTESPRWYAPSNKTFTFLRLSLLNSSANDFSVDIKKNGSIVESITLSSGNVTITETISIAMTIGDYLTVIVSDVGSAANASLEML